MSSSSSSSSSSSPTVTVADLKSSVFHAAFGGQHERLERKLKELKEFCRGNDYVFKIAIDGKHEHKRLNEAVCPLIATQMGKHVGKELNSSTLDGGEKVHFSARPSDYDKCAVLLVKYGADPDATDKSGLSLWTYPKVLSCHVFHERVVPELLQYLPTGYVPPMFRALREYHEVDTVSFDVAGRDEDCPVKIFEMENAAKYIGKTAALYFRAQRQFDHRSNNTVRAFCKWCDRLVEVLLLSGINAGGARDHTAVDVDDPAHFKHAIRLTAMNRGVQVHLKEGVHKFVGSSPYGAAVFARAVAIAICVRVPSASYREHRFEKWIDRVQAVASQLLADVPVFGNGQRCTPRNRPTSLLELAAACKRDDKPMMLFLDQFNKFEFALRHREMLNLATINQHNSRAVTEEFWPSNVFIESFDFQNLNDPVNAETDVLTLIQCVDTDSLGREPVALTFDADSLRRLRSRKRRRRSQAS